MFMFTLYLAISDKVLQLPKYDQCDRKFFVSNLVSITRNTSCISYVETKYF